MQCANGDRLVGHWRVRRLSGLLPPGVTKRIGRQEGWTYLFGLPVGHFRREADRLVYRVWPVIDEIEARRDGTFVGRGRLFGLIFCHFRLEPLPAARP
jgi:hypothetical protein